MKLNKIRINTDHDVADAQVIASKIVDPNREEKLDYWQQASRKLLTGTILHLLYKHQALELPPPILPDIVTALSDPENPLEKFWDEMQANNYYNGLPHPFAATAAQKFRKLPQREKATILSSTVFFITQMLDRSKSTVEAKLEDTAIDGAAIPFDPEEAEQLGATSDDMPLEDVIEAAHDREA